jgi:very-short-patch-repair endonuclease
MSKDPRVVNVTRGFRLSRNQALKAVENCSCAWVEVGVTVRNLNAAEAAEARKAQARLRKPPELKGSIVWSSLDPEGKFGAQLAGRTLSEKALESAMCGAGIEFTIQESIGPYWADFYVPRSRLVVEVDGSVHGIPEQMDHDRRRDLYMEQQGYAVIRFTNSEVETDVGGVIRKITSAADTFRNLTEKEQKYILAIQKHGALKMGAETADEGHASY